MFHAKSGESMKIHQRLRRSTLGYTIGNTKWAKRQRKRRKSLIHFTNYISFNCVLVHLHWIGTSVWNRLLHSRCASAFYRARALLICGSVGVCMWLCERPLVSCFYSSYKLHCYCHCCCGDFFSSSLGISIFRALSLTKPQLVRVNWDHCKKKQKKNQNRAMRLR